MGETEPLAPKTDRTAGHEHNAVTAVLRSGDAAGETIDRCGGLTPQQAGSKLHHPKGHAVGAPTSRASRLSIRWTRS